MRTDLKYHIWTIGCQMNEADSRRLAELLESHGFAAADNEQNADILIVNTCVVRAQAEDKVYERLNHLRGMKRRNPSLIIALMGCLVGRKVDRSLTERFPFVDVLMPPSDVEPLLNHLSESFPEQPPPGPSGRPQPVCDLIPVVLGCSHACTYCIIPYRRGAERSRPVSDILQDARDLAKAGAREVTLLGQIVDRYGLDLEEDIDLAGLLEKVAAIDGIERIRFLTSHPNWINDRLIDAVAGIDKVCPHIEVPFQAGNDKILADMKRGYTSDDYRRLVDRLRARIPDVAIHTDIIVGFPGETDEQFMDTHRLMLDTQPDMARLAKYSPRPQTWAARKLEDNVPPEEKERRRAMLDEALAEMLAKKHGPYRGRIVEVLVEEKGKRNRWKGRTVQNKLVFFEDDRELRGRLIDVVLDWTGPFSFIGHPADRPAVVEV